jgi:hypothetical protein
VDRDQQIRAAAVVALVIVLVGVLYTQVIRTPTTPGVGAGVGTTAATLTVPELTESDVDVARLMDNIKDVEFDYSEENPGRDPMTSLAVRIGVINKDGELVGGPIPPAELLYEAERMELTAIAGNERNRVATVTLLGDEYVVQAGHRFDVGILVKRITNNSVVLAVPMQDEDIELTHDLPEMNTP